MSWLKGNRKLIFALGGLIISGILAVVGKINPDQLVEIWAWLAGAFIVGNGAEHIANAIGKKNGSTG